jgi:hypothetical protein
MNMEMAAREKDFVVKNTGIDGNSVQIMEVVDADGYGNSIQVYVKCGNLSVILSRDMEIYNSAGDFIFDEEKYYMTLSGLMKETDKLIRFNKLPDYLIDELLPYLFMNGSAVPDDMKNSYVYSLCRDFF